jgi:hypothetical protein
MEMIGPNQAIFDYIGNGYRYVSENDAEAPLGTGSEIHHVASLRGDSSVIQDFSPTENAALNNTRSSSLLARGGSACSLMGSG